MWSLALFGESCHHGCFLNDWCVKRLSKYDRYGVFGLVLDVYC